MKTTLKTAVGGIITALSVVCMLITAIVPAATFCCPIMAGILLVVVVIELNTHWAFCVYFAVSILSLLLVPDKEAVVYYIALFGYYPILKQFTEKLKSRFIQWILKLLIFNIAAVIAFFITIYVLGVPKESFVIAGLYLPWVFLIAGDVIFILYDTALSGVITKYILKYRKYIFKKKW